MMAYLIVTLTHYDCQPVSPTYDKVSVFTFLFRLSAVLTKGSDTP